MNSHPREAKALYVSETSKNLTVRSTKSWTVSVNTKRSDLTEKWNDNISSYGSWALQPADPGALATPRARESWCFTTPLCHGWGMAIVKKRTLSWEQEEENYPKQVGSEKRNTTEKLCKVKAAQYPLDVILEGHWWTAGKAFHWHHGDRSQISVKWELKVQLKILAIRRMGETLVIRSDHKVGKFKINAILALLKAKEKEPMEKAELRTQRGQGAGAVWEVNLTGRDLKSNLVGGGTFLPWGRGFIRAGRQHDCVFPF